MNKRPKFEELNDYPEPEKGRNWLLLSLVGLFIIGLAYVGAHYWYQCSDWGIIKFCSVIQKP